MSDSAANRFGEKIDFEVIPSKRYVGQSYRQHSLWMAHWTRTSSSAEPQNGKSCNPLEDAGYSKDSGTFPFELMKTGGAERLMVGVSHEAASAGNTRQFSSNMWGVAHDVCQEVQYKNIDQIDRSFGSSLMQKNVNLYAAKTVVAERISVHKLSDLSVDSHKLLSSDNMSSEWSHFPMFEINRKIDSILNPRRRSSDRIFVPEKSLKVNMSKSNVMAFSSEEYQFRTRRVTDESMSQCKSAGGIPYVLDGHINLNSDHAREKLKGHLTIEESCSCSKDGTNSSCSLADERRASHYFANSRESPRWSTENKFMFLESRKENEIVEDSFLEPKSGASEGLQKQEDFERAVFPEPVLGRGYETKPVNTPAISRANELDTDDHDMVFTNLLPGEHQHLTTNRVNSAVNLTESCELHGTVKKMVTVKSKSEWLPHGKPPKYKMKNNKQKGPCLFEMLTLPSKSYATRSEDPTSSGNPHGNMGSCLLGAQKHFSTKNDTLHSDTHHASKPTAGFASTSIQKVADSSAKGVSRCSKGTETLNASVEHHNACSKATCASKQEWSMSKTSSMNLDLVLFQISRLKNPISNSQTESAVFSDPSDKWLKRLRREISDPHVPCSKRPKIGDVPPPGGTCTMFGRVLDFDGDNIGMVKDVRSNQNHKRHESLMGQQNQEGSNISEKSLNNWVGRWCQGGTPIYHGSTNIEKQVPRSNMPPDDLEGQFPSIAAMAMMGRVMNKLRPCELQRRGPSVVWKTEGL